MSASDRDDQRWQFAGRRRCEKTCRHAIRSHTSCRVGTTWPGRRQLVRAPDALHVGEGLKPKVRCHDSSRTHYTTTCHGERYSNAQQHLTLKAAAQIRLTEACQRKKGAWMKSIRAGRRLHAASGPPGLAAPCGAKKSGMTSWSTSLFGCFISLVYVAALNVSACDSALSIRHTRVSWMLPAEAALQRTSASGRILSNSRCPLAPRMVICSGYTICSADRHPGVSLTQRQASISQDDYPWTTGRVPRRSSCMIRAYERGSQRCAGGRAEVAPAE